MKCQVKNPSPSKGSCFHQHAASPAKTQITEHPSICDVRFASSGTSGVVDLGASQTVIGSKQVVELLEGLPKEIRQRVRRDPCHLVFRFGNHQTLTSKQAIMIPLRDQWFRVAVVPGLRPLLLSSTFLNQIHAVIDTEAGTLWGKMLNKQLILERAARKLFLMDMNQLWEPANIACATTATGPDEVQESCDGQPESNGDPKDSNHVTSAPSQDNHVMTGSPKSGLSKGPDAHPFSTSCLHRDNQGSSCSEQCSSVPTCISLALQFKEFGRQPIRKS